MESNFGTEKWWLNYPSQLSEVKCVAWLFSVDFQRLRLLYYNSQYHLFIYFIDIFFKTSWSKYAVLLLAGDSCSVILVAFFSCFSALGLKLILSLWAFIFYGPQPNWDFILLLSEITISFHFLWVAWCLLIIPCRVKSCLLAQMWDARFIV